MENVEPSRSALMAKIGPKDSKAEMAVRRTAHALGYRFRLHRRDLPGTPDLVFPSRRKIVFVHGCFWHRHEGCKATTIPKTRVEYWTKKFEENVARDLRQVNALTGSGWDVLVIWECETRDTEDLRERLERFLGERPKNDESS
jgi:DNA mismatch endonuclease (patch repair protein)